MIQTPRPKDVHRWVIIRLREPPSEIIGYVDAPSEATAIKKAIRAYCIADPEEQARLLALRMDTA